MSEFNDFSKKTIKEIRLWAWFAAVFPMGVLVLIFLIWLFEPKKIFDVAMVTGGTVMFIMAVIWWWWALHAIRTLLEHWDGTKDGVLAALHEIKEIKALVINLFRRQTDK